MADFSELIKMVETGKVKAVKELVNAAIADGVEPKVILDEGLLPGMSNIGEKFKNNEVYVPEVLIAARAMNAGVTILKPLMASGEMADAGTAVIGTVKGDLHDIGKNLVGMMIEGAGFDVIDLGVDVPADKFIEAMKANPDCKIVALSALLTTTMPAIKNTIDAIVASGLRDTVKIMIGGAPVTQAFADEVGADGYSEDAASAAELAKKLLG